MVHITRCAAALAAIMVAFASSIAAAAPVVVQMEGVGFIVGDPEPLPVSMTLTIDSAQPDEDPTADDYLATGHGDLVVDLFIPPSLPLQLFDVPELIATDYAAGTWTMDVQLIVGQALVPTQVIFAGAGLSPDQIVPDFLSITSGTFAADTGVLLGGPMSGTISITSIVPEPTTALLLGLGLAGLARHRRSQAL